MGEKGLSDAAAPVAEASLVSSAASTVGGAAVDTGGALKDKLVDRGLDAAIDEARDRLRRDAARPAGWHPDPTERFAQRYHDGSAWSAHVLDKDGAQKSDPL